MLRKVNNYWKFKSQSELDSFLNDCIDSGDEYELTSFGLSARGEYYAYGNVTFNIKFGTKAQQQQNAEEEQKKVVTTF